MTAMSFYCRVLLPLALLAGAAPAALADLQSRVSVTADPAQLKAAMQQMSAPQRAKLQANPMFQKGGLAATFFVSGNKTRIDFVDLSGAGPMAIVKSGTPQKTVVLIRSIRQYMTVAPDFDRAPEADQAEAQVSPTSETKVLLGHTARRYQIVLTDRGITQTGEIWAAPDLPALPTGVFPQSPLIQRVWAKVQGMPLEMTMFLSMPDRVTLRYRVVSLSTARLPASVFTIPLGYKPTKD